jgi:hypothetical protein
VADWKEELNATGVPESEIIRFKEIGTRLRQTGN